MSTLLELHDQPLFKGCPTPRQAPGRPSLCPRPRPAARVLPAGRASAGAAVPALAFPPAGAPGRGGHSGGLWRGPWLGGLWGALEERAGFPRPHVLLVPQVSKEEEVEENETEWLMEEIQAPGPRPGRDGQENGHIATKAVKAEALASLHGDDQDSEDEVLTIPEVRVHSGRGIGADSTHPVRIPPRKMFRDDRAGLVSGEKGCLGLPRAAALKPGTPGRLVSFHDDSDDSDEDLLNI